MSYGGHCSGSHDPRTASLNRTATAHAAATIPHPAPANVRRATAAQAATWETYPCKRRGMGRLTLPEPYFGSSNLSTPTEYALA